MAIQDWELLKNHILDLAPDRLSQNNPLIISTLLAQFKTIPVALDSALASLYTFLKINTTTNSILLGTRKGELTSFDLTTRKNKLLGYFNRAITDAKVNRDGVFVTNMGIMNPMVKPSGKSNMKAGSSTIAYCDSLHRPVLTLYRDLDENGTEDIVIIEFGDSKGSLTWLEKDEFGFYKSKTLLNLPGTL